MIFGIIGPIASGKDAVANYLVKRYGFKKIVMSNFLRAEARKRKIKCTRDNLRELQHKLRRRFGEDYLINKAIIEIKKRKLKKVVLDGLRTYIDVKIAKQELHAKILIVDADPAIRFERQKKRRRTGFDKTFKQFLEEEKKEQKEFHLEKTYKLADFRIDNSWTLERMKKNVDKIMNKIKDN